VLEKVVSGWVAATFSQLACFVREVLSCSLLLFYFFLLPLVRHDYGAISLEFAD
jgi:hypothetical protein